MTCLESNTSLPEQRQLAPNTYLLGKFKAGRTQLA